MASLDSSPPLSIDTRVRNAAETHANPCGTVSRELFHAALAPCTEGGRLRHRSGLITRDRPLDMPLERTPYGTVLEFENGIMKHSGFPRFVPDNTEKGRFGSEF